MNIIGWFKKNFKTVYCNECKHQSDDTWYGKYDCHASPISIIKKTGSLIERPKTKVLQGYNFCKDVKTFPWCSKFKKDE